MDTFAAPSEEPGICVVTLLATATHPDTPCTWCHIRFYLAKEFLLTLAGMAAIQSSSSKALAQHVPSTEHSTVLHRQQAGSKNHQDLQLSRSCWFMGKARIKLYHIRTVHGPPTPVAGCNIPRLLSWWRGLNITGAARWPRRNRNHHQLLTHNFTPVCGLGFCHGKLNEECDIQIYRCISEEKK